MTTTRPATLKGRARAIDGRFRSLADLVGICERRAARNDPEPLLVARARKDLDREIAFDHRGAAVREDLVELAARLDVVAPRTEAPRVGFIGLVAVLGVEVDALALLEGDARARLAAWIARQLEGTVSIFDLATVKVAEIEDLIARAKAAGVKVQRKNWREQLEEAERRADSARQRLDDALGDARDTLARILGQGEAEALAKDLGVDLAAPPDALKARLRALARENHPDVGGDHARMVRVNRLRELVMLDTLEGA